MPLRRLRGETQGFPPVFNEYSRVLILGSYPSPQSFTQGFYYGHPKNRFWPLMARLTGEPLPQSIQQKTELLLGHRIALWDALERCHIVGASDSSIKDPIPNDIGALMERAAIEAVFCNGAASHRFYTRFCLPYTEMPATRLPSTSPANAAFGLARLAEEWAPLSRYIE